MGAVKRTIFLFGILVLISGGLGFSAECLAQDNRAVVYWVGFLKSKLELPGKIENIFCGAGSVFEIPAAYCQQVVYPTRSLGSVREGEGGQDPTFEEVFAAAVAESLRKLEGITNPILDIVLDSHGTRYGEIVCPTDCDVSDPPSGAVGSIIWRQLERQNRLRCVRHDDFLDKIFEKIDAFEQTNQTEVQVNFFYNACHSGSLISDLEYRRRENGSRYRVNLFASAPGRSTAWGDKFWRILRFVGLLSKEENRCERGTEASALPLGFSREFCDMFVTLEPLFSANSVYPMNDHVVWRSFGTGEGETSWLSSVVRSVDSAMHNPRREIPDFCGMSSSGGVPVPRENLIRNLNQLLDDEDPWIRTAAAKMLGSFGHFASSAVPALLKALGDRFEDVSGSAIDALGNIGLSAVPGLIATINHQNRRIRENTRAALAKIGPDAVPALMEIIREGFIQMDEEAQLMAIDILGRMRPLPEEAIVELQRLSRNNHPILDNSSRRIHEAATNALDNK